MAADNRVRIIVMYEGLRWFFVRMDSPNRPLLADFESIGSAALLSRESAVALCKRLQEGGWKARIETPSGAVLYEETLTTPSPVKTPDPQNMTVAGILIVAGNPPRGGFYIRFPGTQIESLWGSTPEETYQRLLDHPLSADLIKVAEKYIAPEPPIVDPREIQRSLQFERRGRIRRPDLG